MHKVSKSQNRFKCSFSGFGLGRNTFFLSIQFIFNSKLRHHTHKLSFDANKMEVEGVENNDPTMSPIVLLESQKDHQLRICELMKRRNFVLDFSMLGAGKTQTSSKYAIDHGFRHVVIVCPVSVQPKWRMMSTVHGVPIRNILSQQSLRSHKHKQPSHGLLTRRDYTTRQLKPRHVETDFDPWLEIEKVDFKPSEKYLSMMREGLLLIVDEIQNIKNVSGQFLAAQAMLKPILEAPIRDFTEPQGSKVILLSGSPIDRSQQSHNLFRALNIQKSDILARFNFQQQRMDWVGLQEIYDYCQALDAAATEAIQRPSNRDTSDTALIPQVQRLFQNVLKKQCSSTMLPPPIPVKVYKRNAFQPQNDSEGIEVIRRGIKFLKEAVSFNESTAQVGFGSNAAQTMTGITRGLQVIETGKINLFRDLALEALENHPQQKVVIAVNFTDTIQDLKTLFEALGHAVLVLNGSVSSEGRSRVMALFQTPSTQHRILLANQSVISTGIDLDDKHGSYPRICFVSPNQSTITAFQLGHRFHRADTKSDSAVHFVQAKNGKSFAWNHPIQDTIEVRVLNSLAAKGAIMKETTPEQLTVGVVFPSDHEPFDIVE